MPEISAIDYAVFAGSLLLSIGTGSYHAIKSKMLLRDPKNRVSEKDEYLMGGRKMPSLPVALSLLTSFLSGILMLGVPAEMYNRGAQIWLNFVIGAISSIITAIVFLPIFYKMNSTCLHEYFILRFNSPVIRQMFSFLFIAFSLIYMAVVIYAPAVALSSVLNINKTYLILAIMMYGGVAALIYKGLSHERVGGIGRVWDIASETGRISELWRMDWDPAQYNSLWINIYSGIITWLAAFGVNQLAIQRYNSLPSIETAKSIIYYTTVPFVILCSIVTFVGFIALAYYYNCNPLETGEISDNDHLTILFALDVLHTTPGLFGVYAASILSATLSTLSSGINSMAAAIYEDFLKAKYESRLSDSQVTLLSKCAVLFFGTFSTCLAFAAEPLGGILRVCISVMGALSGPFVGIFALAIFFPRAGFWATFVSFIVSNIAMTVICICNYVSDPFRDLFLPTNTSVHGCEGKNFTLRIPPEYDAHYGDPMTPYIARLSTYSYAGLGFVIMMAIGIPIAYLYKEKNYDEAAIRHLTFAGRHIPCPKLIVHESEVPLTAKGDTTKERGPLLPTAHS
uniref:Sodium-coupled monocarboxylate transporter 2 n=1 Tax=Steinernema glaseri TaxID=37863 RepID=A0A1I7ZD88_9BILA